MIAIRLRTTAAAAAFVLGTATAPLWGQTAAPAPAPTAARYAPWGVDLTARDTSVRPGNDFDAYASGAWLARTTIPDDQGSAGVGYDVYNLSQEQLRTLIDAAPPTGQIGGLYKSFMNEAQVEALDAKPLAADLAAIAAAPDKTAFARLLGEGTGNFGATYFDLELIPDFANPGINVLAVGQGGLGLPDRDYYLQPGFKPQRDAYRAYIERALTMAGYPDPAANADAILAFETEVARVGWARADRRDIDKLNNPMTLPQLAAYAPGFPWATYLSAAGVPTPGKMIVGENSAVKGMAALYAATPLPTLKAYNAFWTINSASPYLSKRFVDSRFAFTKTLSGVATLRPRWKRGAVLLDTALGEEIGRQYVDRYFPASSKAEMTRMVGFLNQAMADRIRTATWMSPATKTEALAKLSAMKVMVGYPDKWRDFSGLRIDANDLYGNVRRSNRFEWQYQLADLNKPVDTLKWAMTPQTVNAYNGGLENKIVFPAGILQPPYFNPAADDAVNYGSAGAIIGHEISHGFDDQGRKIDATGKVRDWWTGEDAARFKAQAAIYGKQFAAYEPVPGTHINPDLTMGENIADLAGLLIAYDAYHKSLGGKPAPVIDGTTGDQRFFLAYAQSWRTKQREDSIRQQVASDPHTPSRFRVLGPVRNVDAWYQAFDVTPKDAYYLAPADRARVW